MPQKLLNGFREFFASANAARDSEPFLDTELPLKADQSDFAVLFARSGEALLLCDEKGKVVACNAAAAILCDLPVELIVGRDREDLVRVERRTGEAWLWGRHNEWRPMGLRESALEGAKALVHLTEPQKSDLSDIIVAAFDSLTKLPTRGLFRDRLDLAMKRSKRSGVPMAVMLLDLDRFKLVNDSLGHDVGDRLLVHVARELTNCLRSIDSIGRDRDPDKTTLSRLGGDEFTVILEAIGSAENAGFVAQRLLDAIAAPFMVGEESFVTEASIGIALFPADNVDLDALIRHADLAMYRSKALGRGMYSFFSEDMNDVVSNRLSLENNLRRAIQAGEFELHYQPKVCARSEQVVGVEALLRWNSPTLGTVRPDQFISVLEDTGMIIPVGAWVIREACAELAKWKRLRLPHIRMAVNMSARQLRHHHLAALIEDSLRENELEADRLEIELTESLLMADNVTSRQMFANFSRIGVRLAIDDFGTGHSSLAYLKRFNVDTLKIDRSFVKALPDDADDRAIATAVIAMGHSMQMSIVAEGVETDAQAECLRELGCDEFQGYLFGRPMPSEQFIEWLKRKLSTGASQGLFSREAAISRPMTLGGLSV